MRVVEEQQWQELLDQRLFVALLSFFLLLLTFLFFFPLRRTLQTLVHRWYLHNVVVAQTKKEEALRNDKDRVHRTVSGIFIYPVKSLRAVEMSTVRLDVKGLEDDRRFMLVVPIPLPAYKHTFEAGEATHRFLTQRQCPSLATVVAKFVTTSDGSRGLRFSTFALPGESLVVSVSRRRSSPSGNEYLATLWDDIVQVQDMGDDAAKFFGKILAEDDQLPDEYKQMDVRLVQQSSSDGRITDENFTPPAARGLPWAANPSVALTDGFPILIATQASLNELNRRIKVKGKTTIDMSRFRPNIVVQGSENMQPFEEDRWKVVSIDGVLFHVVKGCPRCKQSCTDQVIGHVDDEPLTTLREFRRSGKQPDDAFFAQNVIAAPGSRGQTISQGAHVQVLEWGDPVWG